MVNTTVATAKYGTVITKIGSAKIAACILNGTKLNITHAAVGDGGGAYYMPTPEQISLVNECWRGEIAYARISESNPNMIDVKFIVPAEVGGFTVRCCSLIDADGDTIAICNTPDAEKIAITDGVSFPLTMVMHILVSDASVVSFSINPALDTVSREELELALKAHSAAVGSAINTEITIPSDGWFAHELTDPEFIDHPYACDVDVEGCTERHYPIFSLYMAYSLEANTIKFSPAVDTLDSKVRFYAKRIPTTALVGSLQLRSDSLLEDILAMIATNKEVKDEVVDGVWGEGGESDGSTDDENNTEDVPDGYTVATDEEIKTEIVEGVFGQYDR